MGKGTSAKGKHNTKKVHIPCRRCGNSSYHARKGICASCGYGKTARLRSYAWAKLRD
ncbi:MAG: 50S ribosomal protein L37e [Euryarchaeota archaeon]|nr:50S ribosomal protein L37e [Euryarchaeota archaeon]